MKGAQVSEFLDERRRFSEGRRREVTQELARADTIREISNLTIYVCGSLGRNEAGPGSDLDLFLLLDDTDSAPEVTNIQRYEVFAQIIRTHEKLKYGPPSNDGQFLAVHSLQAMLEHLGGP